MREPELRIGFIIFNPYWKQELRWHNGHRKTACEWIENNGLKKLFLEMYGTNHVYDEEDFLTNYIGAIKLYATGGQFYCYVPPIISPEKDYLRNYYENLGYHIIENHIYDEKKIKDEISSNYQYTKTVVKIKNVYTYNPVKDGD